MVGVQPLIAPGEEYQYTSGAIIETPLGTMQGHYEMIDENGVPFSIDIPVFRLAVPHSFIKRIWRHTLLATFMVVTMN